MIRSLLISSAQWLLTDEHRRRAGITGLMLASVLGMTVSSIAAADDPLTGDLFSEITMSDTTDSRSSAPQLGRNSNQILGVVSLAKVLSRGQIKSDLQSQTVVVAVNDLVPESSGLPSEKLRLTVDAEAGRIHALLPIDRLAVGAPTDGAELMKLLVALNRFSNVQLIASGQTLALHSSLSNQQVTSDRIRIVAQRLAAAATNTSTLGTTVTRQQSSSNNEAPGTEPEKTKSSSESTSPVTAVKPASIAGTWSAKTSSADAWAIRFTDDGNFVGVHTNGGKNSVSRGQYQAQANRLVLSEPAGVTLSGTLQRTSENAFVWQVQNKSGQVITSLSFSKPR